MIAGSFNRARQFVQKHERTLSIMAFALGFLWDSLTLTRVDRLFDNIVLASYLVLVLVAIVLLNARTAGRLQKFPQKGAAFLQLLLPFAFGGLFSAFIIFYSRSGEVFVSAPFLLILAFLLFGSELFRKHYQLFVYQMSVFFVALFSYSALILPVLVRRIGDVIFLLSGLVALSAFALVIKLMKRVAAEELLKSRRYLFPIVGMIYVTFNVLYFNNMIPPIPLSLKEIGVYHSVARVEGGYQFEYEKPRWYEVGQKTSDVFHYTGDPAYVFSSVFAPTNLNTEIRHRWSYIDSRTDKWVTASVIRFPISGGRHEGFRGYSLKESLTPGKWRVDVETVRGQVIGRFTFEVEVGAPRSRITEIR